MLAAVLLHLVAANWGVRHLDLQSTPETPETVVEVALKAPALPLPPKASPLLVRPPPPPIHRKQPAAAPSPQPPAPPDTAQKQEAAPSAPPVVTAADSSWQVATSDNGDPAGADRARPAASDTTPQTAATQPPAPAPVPAWHMAPPPSVELKYDVSGLKDGNTVHGGGRIVWNREDQHYRINGTASVLFFTLLDFSSEGALADGALTPALYTEKRFRKPATQTHFQQPRNTITFSESSNRYADADNAQDRASIIWQLAAIGRGTPAAYTAGAVFEFFVAGVRDAEPWRLQVLGDEQLAPGTGISGSIAGDAPLQAWHLVRLPRGGSADQKIDIWLAPQREWYPVRIRYTETNGEYLDMTLAHLTPLPA